MVERLWALSVGGHATSFLCVKWLGTQQRYIITGKHHYKYDANTTKLLPLFLSSPVEVSSHPIFGRLRYCYGSCLYCTVEGMDFMPKNDQISEGGEKKPWHLVTRAAGVYFLLQPFSCRGSMKCFYASPLIQTKEEERTAQKEENKAEEEEGLLCFFNL